MINTKLESWFVVEADDMVTSVFKGMHKPEVLATVRLLQRCEELVMCEIPGATLGTKMHVQHVKSTVIGATVVINAECISVSCDGRRTLWHLVIGDQFETLSYMILEFITVDLRWYRDRYVTPKLEKINNGSTARHAYQATRYRRYYSNGTREQPRVPTDSR